MRVIDELQFFADSVVAAQDEGAEPPHALPATPATRPSSTPFRSRRPREGRARTISTREMTNRDIETGRALYPETGYWKPKTRADCVDGVRPCPYVSCAYHLYLDASRTGAIKLNFPDLEVWELGESCALDVAAFGGCKLEEVGAMLNLTRERVRQIEVKGLAKLERSKRAKVLRELADDEGVRRRRLPVLADPVDDDEAQEPEPEEDDDAE